MHKDLGPMIILLRSRGTPSVLDQSGVCYKWQRLRKAWKLEVTDGVCGVLGCRGRWVLVPRPARHGGDRMVKYCTGCSSYVSEVTSCGEHMIQGGSSSQQGVCGKGLPGVGASLQGRYSEGDTGLLWKIPGFPGR